VERPIRPPEPVAPLAVGARETARSREPTPLLVDTVGAARLLGISERHVRNLWRTRRIPPPIALGRARRWSVDALRAWVAERTCAP
jgi:predicted DNA-binding transcriptional regulator AlpA